FQDVGDRGGQAATWDSLGYAHHHLGHHTHAITSYHHALTLFRDLGDRYYEATILTRIGDTHHTTGNHHPPHNARHQALTILDDPNPPAADHPRPNLATLDIHTLDPAGRDANDDDQRPGSP